MEQRCPFGRKLRLVAAAAALSLFAAHALGAAPPAIRFDHLWVFVSRNAPERAALQRAGFRISPIVNRHDGQGTASVTAEFYNAFLELLWLDPTVPVAAGNERATEKFRQRTLWRTSGWCPFGIGLGRTGAANMALPLPGLWSISPDWLRSGTAIEMLTPRDDTTSPSLFIVPQYLAVDESANRKSAQGRAGSAVAAVFAHPIGVKRVTALRLVSPGAYRPIEALTYLERAGVVALGRGDAWLAEITFDNGRRRKTQDLRPELPLLIRY